MPRIYTIIFVTTFEKVFSSLAKSQRSNAVSRRETIAATLVSEKRSFEFAGVEARYVVRGSRGGGGARQRRGDARSPATRRSAALDGRRLKARNRYASAACPRPQYLLATQAQTTRWVPILLFTIAYHWRVARVDYTA
ncbi:unnamed protein product [Leptosia nina]|uniref:Uncharacterized protein n=1 Tax=Leptosia nina TaxID=320188 RepID=A0AAV1JWG8_9NEOP